MWVLGSLVGAVFGLLANSFWLVSMAVFDDRLSWHKALDRVLLHPTERYHWLLIFEVTPGVVNGLLGGVFGKLGVPRWALLPMALVPVLHMMIHGKHSMVILLTIVPATLTWLAGDMGHHLATRKSPPTKLDTPRGD